MGLGKLIAFAPMVSPEANLASGFAAGSAAGGDGSEVLISSPLPAVFVATEAVGDATFGLEVVERSSVVGATAAGRLLEALSLVFVGCALLSASANGWLSAVLVAGLATGAPVVVVGAVLTMALLGLAASAIPALRALAVNPSRLMREE